MPNPSPTDAELLERIPDPRAVTLFYERHFDAVLRFAVRRCAEPEDAADLVSTVFLEVFAAASSFDARRGTGRAWLLGIAARCLADAQRHGYRRHHLTARLGGEVSLDEDQYERVEQMIDAARAGPRVERTLHGRLTVAEREMFLLVAADGLTPSEAAAALGLSPVVARMRLSRARRKLRAALAAEPAARQTPVAATPHTNGDR